jgi:hypothetical protein
MERMQFKTEIQADKAKVYQMMLEKEGYRQWTSVFNPSSDYEGSWNKGDKISFIGVNKEGKKEGMVGLIKENIPQEFVSIEYIGMLDNGQEVTEGPVVEDWLGSFENYTFSGNNGQSTVTVDVDVHEQMSDYFKTTYPKALEKLKEICEA